MLVLPTEPVTPRMVALAPVARRAAERLERREHVVDQHMRSVDRLRDDRSGSTGGKGAVDELVAVMDRARHGDEQVAGPDLAAVEGDAGDFEGRAGRAAGRGRDFVGGPERAHAAHSRATSASSNGSTRSPTIWPVSWPLPATRTMSPARGDADRFGDGFAAAGDLGRAGRAGHDVGADRAGSSLRGLSSVTMTTSDRPRRDRAHLRALALVAVAAGAEHGDQPALRRAAEARRSPPRARRAVWA